MDITFDSIATLTGPELITLFNELTGEGVKRFSTRAAGIKRTQAAFQLKVGNESVKAQTATKAKPKATAGVARRKLISFPVKDLIKKHRPGTRRATTVDMLSRKNGATVQEVMDAINWDYKTAYEGIKLLHVYTGYGLQEDANGRIRLLGTPTG